MEVASFNVWSYIGFPADAEKTWMNSSPLHNHPSSEGFAIVPISSAQNFVPHNRHNPNNGNSNLSADKLRRLPNISRLSKTKGLQLGMDLRRSIWRATGSSVRYCWYIILIYLVRLKLDYFRLIHGILKESVQQKDRKIFDTPYLLPSHTSWPVEAISLTWEDQTGPRLLEATPPRSMPRIPQQWHRQSTELSCQPKADSKYADHFLDKPDKPNHQKNTAANCWGHALVSGIKL